MVLKVNASPSEFDIYYESLRPKKKRTTDIRSYFATSADAQTAEQGAEQNDGEVAGASGLQVAVVVIEPDSEQIEDISTPPTEPQVEPIEDIATES